uniref:Uncharacterized protein n=1 Tax=Anguilla anguilla TaxID=7936 RepID=A0A0E9VK87_ANGAN
MKQLMVCSPILRHYKYITHR